MQSLLGPNVDQRLHRGGSTQCHTNQRCCSPQLALWSYFGKGSLLEICSKLALSDYPQDCFMELPWVKSPGLLLTISNGVALESPCVVTPQSCSKELSTDLFCKVDLWNCSVELPNGIALWSCSTELLNGATLQAQSILPCVTSGTFTVPTPVFWRASQKQKWHQ